MHVSLLGEIMEVKQPMEFHHSYQIFVVTGDDQKGMRSLYNNKSINIFSIINTFIIST